MSFKDYQQDILRTNDRNEEEEGLDACSNCLVVFFRIITILLFPLTMWSAIKIIAEYERAVIFRVGRISGNKAVGPGLFFIIPCTDSFVKVLTDHLKPLINSQLLFRLICERFHSTFRPKKS